MECYAGRRSMDDRLVPCNACLRHVRCAEVACPFCGAALSTGPMPSREPFRRMAAAAAVAAGVAALTGCGDSGGHGSGTAFYGSPGISNDAGDDTGSLGVFYGAPNPEDASLVAFYGSASFDAAGLPPDASDSGMTNPSDAETDAPQSG